MYFLCSTLSPPTKKKGRVALELKDKKRGFKRIEKHESEVHEFSDIN